MRASKFEKAEILNIYITWSFNLHIHFVDTVVQLATTGIEALDQPQLLQHVRSTWWIFCWRLGWISRQQRRQVQQLSTWQQRMVSCQRLGHVGTGILMDFRWFSHGLFSNGFIMALGKSTGEHMEVSMGYPTMDEGKSHENPMKIWMMTGGTSISGPSQYIP